MRSLTYCGTAALPGVRIYAGASNKLELQRWTGHAGSGWARFSTPDRNSLPGLSGLTERYRIRQTTPPSLSSRLPLNTLFLTMPIS
jgi:hypothetical protein